MMGASEDRATLAEHERQRKASNVDEIMVPGHGIWTKAALAALMDQEVQRQAEQEKLWREMGML